ncbi:MAG: PKD domain-containing protein [Candidatus Thermoplasmatota archaeon]|nr:PKD domain-containing protein [Candidatus Thermoplasmatota archaeon]
MIRRNLSQNREGISPVLESLVAIGISISLLIVFFVAANSIYSTHDRPKVDLEAKSIDIMELLVNSPGQGSGHTPGWENDIENISIIGLATYPTVEYGIFNISEEGDITVVSRERVKDSRIGIAESCFLAGTQVVMADESYKNIEDIVVGDMIKSYNEETKTITEREVKNIYHHAAEEMGEYYLVINDCLRLTPNHRVYSEGSWIDAGGLHIGDTLSFSSTAIVINSLEQRYEQVPTYDLGIDTDHCYFVAIDNNNALVHNLIPPTADANGPYYGKPGEPITFDGTGSTEDPWEHDPIVQYDWDFGDGQGLQEDIGATPTWTYDEPGEYEVTLWVEDSRGDRSLTSPEWMFPDATTTATVGYAPVAHFSFFDSDGLGSGTEIRFDASDSVLNAEEATFEWWWYWDTSWDETSPPGAPNATGANPTYDYENNGAYYVMLRVNNTVANDTCVHVVQANTLTLPDDDAKPWVAVSKDIFPDSSSETMASVGSNYYVNYTHIAENSYLFEVKYKTSKNIILDYHKVKNLQKISDENATVLLNLDTSKTMFYNVNITISNDEGIITSFGPSRESANAIESISREILIYYKPQLVAGGAFGELWSPYYENGLISVHVFI